MACDARAGVRGLNARRGQVWYVAPDLPTVGAEIRKDRPCLVVQPPEMDFLRTTIVAPLSGRGFAAPFRVPTKFGKSRFVLLDHLRAIDRSRLRRYAGDLDDAELAAVLGALQAIFAP
ncbi:MAG TPA: type II toxin-antitoxin system PemK/MazF family toxin [Candidatus Tyrphobacter sp.]